VQAFVIAFTFFMVLTKRKCERGRDSSVGVATSYGMEGPGIESRWWTRFSALVQTGRGEHAASCTMGTGSLPGVECGRGVVLTSHPLIVPRSINRVELYPTLPKGLRGL
jgi:hypothetical protein